MTDHPTEPVQPAPQAEGSGNRWEPTAPPPAYPPPPSADPAAPTERRRNLPGPSFWYAGAAAAVIVLVACAGFLVGRASVDGHDGTPVQMQRQLPQDGGQQFGDGVPPGGTPQQLPGQ